MKRIYLIGHGFMDKNVVIESLPVDVVTYVKEDELYTGTDTAKLIDDDSYDVSNPPRELKEHEKGTAIHEHYFVSDVLSYNDVNKTKSWGSIGGHNAKKFLSNNRGRLYPLGNERYLFFTQRYDQCVRLSTLIDDLADSFPDCDFEIHWTACRSYVEGATVSEKLGQMNKGQLVNGITEVR